MGSIAAGTRNQCGADSADYLYDASGGGSGRVTENGALVDLSLHLAAG